VHTSIRALIKTNTELAWHVLAEEPRINELEIRNGDLTRALLSLEHPVASDLRSSRPP
jgi:phosphate uptake regulator